MSEFSSEGYESFPSIYADTKLIHEFGALDRQILEDRLTTYIQFLKRDDLMPRARDNASRIREHLLFELMYRDGLFDDENEAV